VLLRSRLTDDVSSGAADLSALLVYDVSRSGRFQEADESAYYEYICKEAVTAVHYCAEQFESDASLSATIIKGMKRAMARDLGAGVRRRARHRPRDLSRFYGLAWC
jgi:DNA invertase Pin-like site-specific DNA recombinase